jgi:hypothetical protein
MINRQMAEIIRNQQPLTLLQTTTIVSRGDFRGLERDRLDEETGIWERR